MPSVVRLGECCGPEVVSGGEFPVLLCAFEVASSLCGDSHEAMGLCRLDECRRGCLLCYSRKAHGLVAGSSRSVQGRCR